MSSVLGDEDPIDLLLETAIVLDPLHARTSLISRESYSVAISRMSSRHASISSPDNIRRLTGFTSEYPGSCPDDEKFVSLLSYHQDFHHLHQKTPVFIYTVAWLVPLLVLRTVMREWSPSSLPLFIWKLTTITGASLGLGVISAGLLYPPGILGEVNRHVWTDDLLHKDEGTSSSLRKFSFFNTSDNTINLRQSAAFVWAAAAGCLGVLLIWICDWGLNIEVVTFILFIEGVLLGLANLNVWLPALHTVRNLGLGLGSHPIFAPWRFANRLNSPTDIAYFSWAKIVMFRGLREVILMYLLLSQGKPAFVARPKVRSDLVAVSPASSTALHFISVFYCIRFWMFQIPPESLFRWEIILEGSYHVILSNKVLSPCLLYSS